MRLELHPEARLEFLGAVAHYESCHPGFGERFIQSIDVARGSIAENPNAWTEIEQDIHHKLTRVFPYSSLYTIESESILVVTIMQYHQAPGYWRTRLSSD